MATFMNEFKYISALNCTSEDNRHCMEYLDHGLAFAQCTECGEKFYLVAESVFKQLEVDTLVERPKVLQ